MTNELKDMTPLEIKIFMLLPLGSERLISTREVTDILNIEERTVRAIVEKLITDYDIPICSFRQSDNYGYFIAETKEEQRLGLLPLKQQTKAMKKRIRKVENADINTAIQYKEKYKHEEPDHDQQLSLLDEAEDADNKPAIEA